MIKNSKVGAEADGVTPSTALLNQQVGICSGYRMLTPYEQELLRKSKKELGEQMRIRFMAKAWPLPERPR